ncbi:hypothetical protein [Prescottella equi]|uniref:hypothetical protein n=1 Tax=Rhodococcus hoagii TaxID=43767 RepID=UPI001EEC2951|nr:hypothetical protein [Prescottella equi]
MPDTDISLDELARRLAAHKERLRHLRRERMDIENTTPNPEPLREAIRQAHRDRDAVVSPEVEELRGQANELAAALEKAWSNADHYRWTLYRLRQAGTLERLSEYGQQQSAALKDLLVEEADLRSRFRDALDAEGVFDFPVPDPFSVPVTTDWGIDGAR